MSVTSVGSLSLAVALPGANAAAIAGAAGINAALPDIASRIAALAAFAPQPISFLANIVVAQGIITSLQAAIAGGISPPSISAQIALVAAQLAALELTAVGINASLTIVTDFISALAAAGIDVYAFDGARNVLGSELAAAVGGSAVHANAIVLVTTNGATWSAMQSVFKTTP